MAVKRIAVIGAGAMGSGIAYQAARNGIEVNLNDMKQEFLDKGVSSIKNMVRTGVDKGKIALKDAKALLDLIHPVLDIKETVKDVDVVVEAIYENMQAKKDLWARIDAAARPDTLFATNTSSLSITEMATSVKNPSKFIGTHFFNPVYTMQLVEIVIGKKTSPQSIEAAIAFATQMQKTPVKVKDSPGFIVNRILAPMMGEAIRLVQDGIASPEDIDTAMRLGANFPVGPLQLTDYVGLDIAKATAETLGKGLGPCYQPPKLLVEKVEKGELGMKSGRGFFQYK
jgi:3-hydroxybutyryl-CoA dehydrogenase